MAEKQGPYEFEPAWRNSSEKKCMRIGNNIELQTDEKNIKVCTWLEHMFSNICFQNQIGGTTNVLFIKRKFEHHYKGSDRYMEMIDIYFFFAPTWCPPQVQPLGERTSLHMSAAEEHLFSTSEIGS